MGGIGYGTHMNPNAQPITIITGHNGQVTGYYVTVTDRRTDGQPEVTRMAARIRRITGKHVRCIQGKVLVINRPSRKGA